MNSPFHVGQKVVAIITKYNVSGFGITKGSVYTIINIHQCKRCGRCWYDLGLEFDIHGHNDCQCGNIMFRPAIGALAAKELLAPIEINYADATNEILEKFPLEVGGTPDKVITPERIKL